MRLRGFTLVELLVVIVVISILATVLVVVYQGVQSRAYDTAVVIDMNNFAKRIVIFRQENDRYPNPSDPGDAEMLTLEYKAAKAMYHTLPTVRRNLVYCTSPDRQHYAFLAKSKSGNAFYESDSTGHKVMPYTETWNSSTYAADLCTSATIGLSASDTDQRTGYWPGHGDWQVWTGIAN